MPFTVVLHADMPERGQVWRLEQIAGNRGAVKARVEHVSVRCYRKHGRRPADKRGEIAHMGQVIDACPVYARHGRFWAIMKSKKRVYSALSRRSGCA